MKLVWSSGMVLSVCAAMIVLVSSNCAAELTASGAARVDFTRDVKPLLDAKCITCHGPLKQKSGLRLDAGVLALKGGKHGTVIEAKNPSASKLLARLTSKDDDERMPPEGKPLTEPEITVFREWVEQGAVFPAQEEITTSPDEHWFFQPPQKATPPVTPAFKKLTRPVDRFLAAEWQSRGLKPQKPADKGTLLRRVYLDLIGLPPLPEEVARFEADKSPDAYERVVDKLLADERHGARWGRHFMDLWRYCDEMLEGEGGKVMVGEHHLWHWRDWIIEAINHGKPYDRMIHELLAADELVPEDSDALRATGYLVRNHSVLGERDGWMADNVEHTAQAFLGVTMKCARCHDHKYDPIPQTDYYRLRAVFDPLEKRLDFLPGIPDSLTNGLARIYDADLGVKSVLYVNGNPQQRDPKQVITPGAPALLRAGDLTPVELNLPVATAHPGRRASVREARLVEVKSAWEKAREAFAKLTSPGTSTQATASNVTNLNAIQLTVAERRLAEAKLAVAETDLLVVEQAIAADDAKAAGKPEAGTLSQNVTVAQRALKRHEAELAVAEAVCVFTKAAADETEKKEQPKTGAAQEKIHEAKEKLTKLDDEEKKPLGDFEPLWKSFPEKSTGRRLALAQWMTSRTNPATARVLVNHVWLRHFGQPLVDTMFDFGMHGHKPTHPALLDWLAVEFMESGWDLKHLHRVLVTSSAYRLSSARQPGSDNERLDAENRYLWRMNSQRMQAEQVRDSILHLSGKLDLAPGGPSIEPSKSDRVFRRSVYFRQTLERGDRMLRAFDSADPNECYRRVESIVPQQALVLANSRLTFEHARLMAKSLTEKANTEDGAFVQAAFARTLGRPPDQEESKACAVYLKTCRDPAKSVATEKPLAVEKEPLVAASTDLAQRARESLVQVLLNHTDFVTIR